MYLLGAPEFPFVAIFFRILWLAKWIEELAGFHPCARAEKKVYGVEARGKRGRKPGMDGEVSRTFGMIVSQRRKGPSVGKFASCSFSFLPIALSLVKPSGLFGRFRLKSGGADSAFVNCQRVVGREDWILTKDEVFFLS